MPRSLASLALGLFACSLAAPVSATEDAPEGVLKTHDLRRSGMSYVLPAEAEVQKKLNEAKALYQRLTVARMRQRQFEQAVSDNRMMVQQMTQQRIMLNQQLSRVTTAQENNRLVAMINQLNDEIDLMRQQAADPAMAKEINAQVPAQREAFTQAVLDLRQLVNQATETYGALAQNEEVKSALDALNQKSKVKFTLGPSRTFQANVKLLEKVESSVLSETVEVRKDGGIYWVDVTFNGKITRSLAFDTGASSVVLPAALAAEIGLKPGNDAPTVQAQVADGSVIEAKQMTIPSVRVGQFTVKDVVCIVMPADKKDVPPLLGQTFLKNFIHKFNGDTGTLVLLQVETPEAEKSAPRAKAAPRSSRTNTNTKRQAPVIERSPAPDGPK
jgi:clan AA aspartic protease (TIGR02281 family)